MDKIEIIRRENIKAHIKKCKSLSELKKLAQMRNNNKVEYLKELEEIEYSQNLKNISQSVSIDTDSSLDSHRRSTVISQPKLAQKKKFLESSQNDWHFELFDCCKNGKLCLYGFMCPPCFSCWLFSKAQEDCCTPILCPCAIVPLRTQIRNHYEINGEIWLDYLAFYLCGCCTMIQIANELQYQGAFI